MGSEQVITFDFGLTNRSETFPNMATFSCLLFALRRPQSGFRGALQQYYETFPQAFLERTIRDQGIWMPFLSDLSGPCAHSNRSLCACKASSLPRQAKDSNGKAS